MTNDIEYDVITSIDLFEYIDALLTNKETYEKIADNVKRQHFFMLQRRLSIRYPNVINLSNINGIDSVAISDMYHAKLYNPNKPKWMYTKTAGIEIQKVKQIVTIDKNYERIIRKVYKIDRKTWESICTRNQDWVYAIADMVDRSIKSKINEQDAQKY